MSETSWRRAISRMMRLAAAASLAMWTIAPAASAASAELVEILLQVRRDRGLGSFHPRLQRRKIDLVRCAIASRAPALLERGQVVSQSRIFERAAKTLVELVGMVDRIRLVPDALRSAHGGVAARHGAHRHSCDRIRLVNEDSSRRRELMWHCRSRTARETRSSRNSQRCW